MMYRHAIDHNSEGVRGEAEKPKQTFWPTQYHLRLNDGKIGLLVKEAGYEEVRGGDV